MTDNNFYRAFEDRYRGSRELIKERLRVYLPFIQPLCTLNGMLAALDVGCGRGEWLELLSETGFDARGVDLDSGMLEACHKLKLNVVQGDGLTVLQALPDESLAIVSGFHIIEHIDFDTLQALVREALRVLKPGGLLILETPNPENLIVAGCKFYFDPSHKRPIPSSQLEFMVEYVGFTRVKILGLQEAETLRDSETDVHLLDVLEGVSPDYAIVAQKSCDEAIARLFDEAFSKELGLKLVDLTHRFEDGLAQREQVLVQQIQGIMDMRVQSELPRIDEQLQHMQDSIQQVQIESKQHIVEIQSELPRIYEQLQSMQSLIQIQIESRQHITEILSNLPRVHEQLHHIQGSIQQIQTEKQDMVENLRLDVSALASRVENGLAQHEKVLTEQAQSISAGIQVEPSRNYEQLQQIQGSTQQVQVELQNTQAELLRAQVELRAVYASTSWKITRPFRGISRVLRGQGKTVCKTEFKRLIHQSAKYGKAHPWFWRSAVFFLNRVPGVKQRLARIISGTVPSPKSEGISKFVAPAMRPSTELSEFSRQFNIKTKNSSSSRNPRLFVDISSLVVHKHKYRTGIQRVVRSILSELLTNPVMNYDVCAVNSEPGSGHYRYSDSFVSWLEIPHAGIGGDGVIDPQRGDIFLGLDLNPQMVNECRDYFHRLRNTGVKVYFVVYDLLPVLMPWAFPDGLPEGHERWLDVVVENDGAICISKAVADDLHRWAIPRRMPDRLPLIIDWFHLGADIESSLPTYGLPENANDTLQKIKSRPTFLMIGTIEPRKGYAQALAAVEKMWSEGHDVNLVIVGGQGWKVEALVAKLKGHSEQEKRLFWLAGISDEYLECLCVASTCLLMASEGEGFGLPLIEAVRHGLPIIARDVSVFREIANNHAYYFSDVSAEGLAAAMIAWLSLFIAGDVPSSTGISYLTWKQSTEQLLQILLPNWKIQKNRPWQEIMHRSQILQLTPYPIKKPRHGGQLRASAIRRSFIENGFDVQTIGFYLEGDYQQDALSSDDVGFSAYSPSRQYKGKFIQDLSDFMMSFLVDDEDVYKKVVQNIRGTIDAIVVEQPWLYPVAKRLQAEIPEFHNTIIVYSSQNIEAPMKRQILEKSLGQLDPIIEDALKDLESLEKKFAREADLCVAVTEDDAQILREFGSKTILVAPNGIDPWSASSDRLEFWRSQLPNVPWPLFIASAHPPNYNGFVDSIGNALGCIPPGSRLVIVGSVGAPLEKLLLDSPSGRLNKSRLQVLGMLADEDLAAVKELAYAFLLPIGGGGGSNIKTAEALYSGKPVICTDVALRGFENYRNLPEVCVVNSPQEFQQAIRSTLAVNSTSVLKDSEANQHLRQKLTWTVCLHEFPSTVSRLSSEKRKIQ